MKAAFVLAAALVAGASAFSITMLNDEPETNVCNMNWNYCPRDPGCSTYTMSVHDVRVRADNYNHPVKASDLKPGDNVTLEVKGKTTITQMPSQGSFRIYGLDGKNVAAGALDKVFTLNAPDFTIEITFEITAHAIGHNGFFEFGLDVFQEASGSDEGVCIELADEAYLAYEKSKPSPAFETYCKDEGDGHFKKEVTPIEGHPLQAPSCTQDCSLHWYLCPRDVGCTTYTMSPDVVVVDVLDKSGVHANDHIHLTVNGTTSITTIPSHGSYRIYDLAGHNAASGVLADALSLHDCGAKGCKFGMHVPFTLPQGAFSSQGWMEFGLDVFQEASGSDEGFCIEIANDAYLHFEQTKPQPPPGFVAYCIDESWGHYVNKTTPEVVHRADCVLSGESSAEIPASIVIPRLGA